CDRLSVYFTSRRRHTRSKRDWSSDVCSSDLGHMSGKMVEPTETLEEKIKVAVAARKNDDFLIMSRTDARTVYDLEEAIERSRRYKAAGADLIFIESPRSFEEFEEIHEAFPDTFMMANMIEGGLTPLTKTAELE